jgi:hypothetical protein
MAIWRFRRDEPKDIWDEPINWPIGDIEAADRIRRICRSAADSAEVVATRARSDQGCEKPSESKRQKSEAERYERAARCAMEIALKVADDLMRDAAVGQIVDLCLRANDLKTARILLRAIQAETIRDDVLNRHPVLRA